MATIIDGVALTEALTSTAVTTNPSYLRIQTEISDAEADEYVIQSYLVNDGITDVPLLNADNVPIQHKLNGNKKVSFLFQKINSVSIKVVLTPGINGNSGSVTVTTIES